MRWVAIFLVGLFLGFLATGVAEDTKFGTGRSPNDPIDCLYVTRLVVVDSDGEERAALEMMPNKYDIKYPQLVMYNPPSKSPMVQLVLLDDTKGPVLKFSNAKGRCYATFPLSDPRPHLAE